MEATRKQILRHYQEQGYEVSIAGDGYVSYRYPARDALWKYGGYALEYRVEDGRVVRK